MYNKAKSFKPTEGFPIPHDSSYNSADYRPLLTYDMLAIRSLLTGFSALACFLNEFCRRGKHIIICGKSAF